MILWHLTKITSFKVADIVIMLKTHDDLLLDPGTEVHKGHLHAQALDNNSQVFFDKSIRLLQHMSDRLTMTLDAWMRFRDKEIAYFSNLERPSGPGRHPNPYLLFVEITRDIEALQALQKSLDYQKDHLKALLQKVSQLEALRYPHLSLCVY